MSLGNLLGAIGDVGSTITGNPVFATVGNYISGQLGAAQTNEQNSENTLLADKFNQDEQIEAQQNNNDMANTTYQRTVADLNAAGLNPMLAYAGNTDPTPSSGAASAVSNPQLTSPTSAGAVNANVAAQTMATNAQTDNTVADTQVKEATRDKLVQDTRTSSASESNLRAQTKQILDLLPDTQSRLVSEIINNNADTNVKIQQVDNLYLTGQLTKAQTSLAKLAIPESTASASFYQGLGSSSPYFEFAQKMLHSAGSAYSFFNK